MASNSRLLPRPALRKTKMSTAALNSGNRNSTFKKSHCAHCNKEFSPTLRSTRKFIVNNNTTINLWEGLLEIQNWRFGIGVGAKESQLQLESQLASAKENIDKDLAVCSICGTIIAKLYNGIKCLVQTENKASYLARFAKKWYNFNYTVKDPVLGDGTGSFQDFDTDFGDDGHESQAPEEPEPKVEEYRLFQNEPPLVILPPKPITGENQEDDDDDESGAQNNDNSTSTKPFLCFQCGKGFHKQTNLTRHLLLSHDIGERPKLYTCEECGKSFYFAYLLKDHAYVHTDERPYECPVEGCSQKFKHKKDWFQHRRNRHNENARKYQCRYCWKAFKDKRGWRWHEEYVHRIPKGAKHFKCEFCGKNYHRQRTQIEHSRKCQQNPAAAAAAPAQKSTEMALTSESNKLKNEQNFSDLNSLVDASVEKYFQEQNP